MKKRTYRAIDVKDMDWTGLEQKLKSQNLERLIVGVDVAKTTMFGVLMSESKEILACLKWNHLEQTRRTLSHLQSLPVPVVQAVLEPSGTYGDALIACWRDAGAEVYRVQPKHVKDAHELYDGVPSRHDAKCAAILAWLHLLGRSELWQEADSYRRDLGAAQRVHDLHAAALRQALGHLEAQLARHWPEVQSLLKLDSAALLELLHRYGDPQEVAASWEAAGSLLRRVGRSGLSEEKIEQVLDCAGQSLGVPVLESERAALRELAGEARRRQQALQAAQRRLRALAEKEPVTKRLGAAVGAVTAAVLYQGLGSFMDYANTGSLIKAAGLNLKERSSGQHQGRLSLTKRGPRRVRQYLYLAVLRWVQNDPWARAWHERKVARDGGLKRKSLIALMRKLLRGLWWVARGERLDTTKLFDTRRLQGTVSI